MPWEIIYSRYSLPPTSWGLFIVVHFQWYSLKTGFQLIITQVLRSWPGGGLLTWWVPMRPPYMYYYAIRVGLAALDVLPGRTEIIIRNYYSRITSSRKTWRRRAVPYTLCVTLSVFNLRVYYRFPTDTRWAVQSLTIHVHVQSSEQPRLGSLARSGGRLP